MGKLVGLIVMLSFIYILFFITGQMDIDSNLSLIIGALVNPTIITTSAWWTSLITGSGAIATILVTSTVIAGIATRNSDIAIFGAMAAGLALIVGDFVGIYNHLASINQPLALIIMSPIIIIFAITIVEWLRNRD